uniref:S100/CaBP-9k-type calcium binding subdomain domain-containing protein n=1 Tax=Terrapene triunguis TaxID=2587831 RepID=A0A674JMF6_9SAUR
MALRLKMLTPLESAVATIIEIFHKYSRNEPHHDKLSKAELKCLIQKELGNVLKVSQPKMGELVLPREEWKDLDVNKDHSVNFKEYMILITTLLILMPRDSNQAHGLGPGSSDSASRFS